MKYVHFSTKNIIDIKDIIVGYLFIMVLNYFLISFHFGFGSIWVSIYRVREEFRVSDLFWSVRFQFRVDFLWVANYKKIGYDDDTLKYSNNGYFTATMQLTKGVKSWIRCFDDYCNHKWRQCYFTSKVRGSTLVQKLVWTPRKAVQPCKMHPKSK